MGIVCSRDGVFQLAPSIVRTAKKIVGSKNQPEIVYHWLQTIRMFPSVQYTEYVMNDKRHVNATAVFKLDKNVCHWKSQPKEDKEFLLEIYTNVCKNALNIHFIENMLLNADYHVVLSVVVPRISVVSEQYLPPVSGKKKRYLKSVEKCASLPIENVGVSIAFYSIMGYPEFLNQYKVLSTSKDALLPLNVVESPIRIQHVCYISLICSNNNGGATLLNFIKDCHRHSFEMYALNAIFSAYSYYLLYGFKRTLDHKAFYPVWHDDKKDVYYYDVESMTFDEFANLKKEITRDALDSLVAFTNDGYNEGYLLTRLVKSKANGG